MKKTVQTTPRPPIVTVLGHVDHGKTTLLDALRKTNLVKKEAGGITQTIGASLVTTKTGKKITFIDTPGHAAFSKMRARGAKVADIVLLVVAANDGVKPQTTEALQHILKANIPFIVVLTKIDLDSADVESVKGQLEKEGVSFEGQGGDTPSVSVSAKEAKGLDELLEMISLVAEVNEVSGDPKGPLEAVVIETQKNKRGPLATVVVREGTLVIREEITADGVSCRIRGLFDEKGNSIPKVFPGEAGQILGFSELPEVGARVEAGEGEISTQKKRPPIKKIKKGQVTIILKAQGTGVLEALTSNLPDGAFLVSSGVGIVSETDVFLAKASGPALILAFESKVPTSVKKLAETEGVKIETFDIIYEVFQRIEEAIKEGEKQILGKAEIVAEFPYNDKKVAGCRVIEGKIVRGKILILTRGEKELGIVRVVSLKKQKEKVSEAKEGDECGILFTPQLDFEIGDMLLSVANE